MHGETVKFTKFNVHLFYSPPIESMCVFCMDINTNIDYLPIQF